MFEDNNFKSDLVLLYAEDEEKIREKYEDFFSDYFKEVKVAENGEQALDIYYETKPDVIILDIEMPYKTGIQVAQEIREKNKDVTIIFMTAYDSAEYLRPAVELGLKKYIKKGTLKFRELEEFIEDVIEDITNNSKEFWRVTPKGFKPVLKWNIIERRLYLDNDEISLTQKETIIFSEFAKHRDEVIETEKLSFVLWGGKDLEDKKCPPEQKIRSFMYQIKKKIGLDIFQAVFKRGYRISDNITVTDNDASKED